MSQSERGGNDCILNYNRTSRESKEGQINKKLGMTIGDKVKERGPSKGRERKGKETSVIVLKNLNARGTKIW